MSAVADICLIVEGTYPYVEGGVAGWTQALIEHLPEYTFAVVHLGSRPEGAREARYALPTNAIGFHELYLHEVDWLDARPPFGAGGRRRRARANPGVAALWARLAELHRALAADAPYDDLGLIRQLIAQGREGLALRDLIDGEASWQLLLERYHARRPDASFVDFFWTFRLTHLPLLNLLRATLPPARLYHPVSAGPAGFLAALGKLRTGNPLVLTEHGVYTREREIEIAQAEWIYREAADASWTTDRLGFFQAWWIAVFRYLTRFAYERADRIVSITAVNQRYQLADGADPRKLLVIPNGVAVGRLAGLRAAGGAARGAEAGVFVVGFVGRVVPIKDVKVLLRALKIASGTIDGLVAYLVGPTDEDPDYFAECAQLVGLLDLGGVVRFVGRADVRDYYRRLDVLALTSLSEAQPLVILEANCAGVPVVATDVGACRELIEGGSAEDRALGPSGIVTPVASPEATAAAIVRLWRDPAFRARCAAAGEARTRRYYREEDVYAAYRGVYGGMLGEGPSASDEPMD